MQSQLFCDYLFVVELVSWLHHFFYSEVFFAGVFERMRDVNGNELAGAPIPAHHNHHHDYYYYRHDDRFPPLLRHLHLPLAEEGFAASVVVDSDDAVTLLCQVRTYHLGRRRSKRRKRTFSLTLDRHDDDDDSDDHDDCFLGSKWKDLSTGLKFRISISTRTQRRVGDPTLRIVWWMIHLEAILRARPRFQGATRA